MPMDANDVLNFLRNAASAGQVGVPVTQPPKYMQAEEPYVQQENQLIADNPKNATAIGNSVMVGPEGWGDLFSKLRPLWAAIQDAEKSSADTRYRQKRQEKVEQPIAPADIANTLRDILQRDTGRSAQ